MTKDLNVGGVAVGTVLGTEHGLAVSQQPTTGSRYVISADASPRGSKVIERTPDTADAVYFRVDQDSPSGRGGVGYWFWYEKAPLATMPLDMIRTTPLTATDTYLSTLFINDVGRVHTARPTGAIHMVDEDQKSPALTGPAWYWFEHFVTADTTDADTDGRIEFGIWKTDGTKVFSWDSALDLDQVIPVGTVAPGRFRLGTSNNTSGYTEYKYSQVVYGDKASGWFGVPSASVTPGDPVNEEPSVRTFWAPTNKWEPTEVYIYWFTNWIRLWTNNTTEPPVEPEPEQLDLTVFPFADTSIWKLARAKNVTLVPTTDPRHASLQLSTVPVWANHGQYSHPINYADTSDVVVSITDRNDSSRSRPASAGYRVPVDVNWATGSDEHSHVFQPGNGLLLEMIGYLRVSETEVSVSRSALVDPTGPGIGPQQGVRAYGGPAIGGLIRDADINPANPLYRGGIKHAVALALNFDQFYFDLPTYQASGSMPGYYTGGTANQAFSDRTGWPVGTPLKGFMIQPGYIWPATEQDWASRNNYTGALPMGAYGTLDPDWDFEASTVLNEDAKKLCRAYRDYGWYITDTTGDGDMIMAYVEDSPACAAWASSIKGPNLNRSRLNLIRSHMRVIDINDPQNPNGGPLGAERMVSSSVTQPVTAPPIPTGVSLAEPGAGTIRITWNPSDQATAYRVYQVGVTAALGTTTETVFNHSGIAPSTSVSYQVTALNGSAESARSAPVTFTTAAAQAPTTGTPKLLFIRSATELVSQAALRALLEEEGYIVTSKADNAFTAADRAAVDGIVIANDTASANVMASDPDMPLWNKPILTFNTGVVTRNDYLDLFNGAPSGLASTAFTVVNEQYGGGLAVNAIHQFWGTSTTTNVTNVTYKGSGGIVILQPASGTNVASVFYPKGSALAGDAGPAAGIRAMGQWVKLADASGFLDAAKIAAKALFTSAFGPVSKTPRALDYTGAATMHKFTAAPSRVSGTGTATVVPAANLEEGQTSAIRMTQTAAASQTIWKFTIANPGPIANRYVRLGLRKPPYSEVYPGQDSTAVGAPTLAPRADLRWVELYLATTEAAFTAGNYVTQRLAVGADSMLGSTWHNVVLDTGNATIVGTVDLNANFAHGRISIDATRTTNGPTVWEAAYLGSVPKVNGKAKLVITIDDGGEAAYTNFLPKLNVHGFKATLFPQPGRFNSDPTALSNAQAQELKNTYGWSYGVHAYQTHVDISGDALVADLDASIAKYTTLGLLGGEKDFAYWGPGSNNSGLNKSSENMAIIKSRFRTGRLAEVRPSKAESLPIANPYSMRCHMADAADTLANLQTFVNRAINTKGAAIMIYHNDPLPIFVDFLAWVKTQVDAGVLEVVTMDQMLNATT